MMTSRNENAPELGGSGAFGQQALTAESLSHGHIDGNKTTLPYPSAHAVIGRVLGALLEGEKLTHLDCWRRFGSSRLSHHIWQLRRDGWPVEMVELEVTTSDADRKATIGEYSLSQETIQSAGERGQDYAAECGRINAERRAA